MKGTNCTAINKDPIDQSIPKSKLWRELDQN